MVKKIFVISLVGILILAGFYGCIHSYYQCQKYKREEDIITLFENKKAMFTEVAEIFASSSKFWDEVRRDEYDHYARLRSPYDTEKMECFIQENQEIITNFFQETRPYEVAVNKFYINKDNILTEDRYITIDYRFNKGEKTGILIFAYCYGDDRDQWIEKMKSYPNFVELDDDWVIY